MSLEAFCYIALRKGADSASRLIQLMADPRQSEAREVLAETGAWSEKDRLASLLEARRRELGELRKPAPGRQVWPGEASPRLSEWMVYRRLQESHGRKNP